MKKLFTLLALLNFTVFSQTQLSGKITSKKDVLIGASIMIKGTYDGGITNLEGKYSFTTKQTDSIYILVKSIGYETKTIPFKITQNKVELDIQLKEKFNELNVVVITAGAFEAGDKKKAITISSLDMVTTPGASGNVINALQFLPGTTTVGESGKLYVRGGTSNESQTFIDGTLVHNPYNASAPNTAVRSRYNPFMFGGTVFSTGGFSAEYGEALSSVLLLETKGIEEESQLDITLMSVGVGLAGTKKWDKSSLTASVDYTNLTPYMKLIPQKTNWIKMPESLESAVSFRKKTNNGMFKFYNNYTQSKFSLNNYDINTDTETKTALTNSNLYFNSSYKGRLTDKWLFSMHSAYTLNNEDITQPSVLLDETTNGGHFKLKVKGKINRRVKLIFGAELLSTDYAQGVSTDFYQNTQRFTNHNIGGFTEGEFYFTEKLVARVGGRYDYSTLLNKSKVSPRISTAYKTSKHSNFSLAYGIFNQSPDKAHLLYTNEVDLENTQQFIANYTINKNKRTLRAELYYKMYDNLIKYNDSVPFYQPNYYNNNGEGYAYGFDLFFRDKKTIKNGDYWVSYSYMNTERNYLNFNQSAVPSFAPKHNVSVVYKHWVSKWRTLFGASFNYSSPRFYNDPNKAEFNSEKMKAYQALNLNASFLYKSNVIFYASATNVLGYQQEYGYEFSDTPNVQGIYEKRVITAPASRFYVLGCFITIAKDKSKNQLDKIQ